MHAASDRRDGRSCRCGVTGLGEQIAALQYDSRSTHADVMPSESAAPQINKVLLQMRDNRKDLCFKCTAEDRRQDC